MDTPPFNTLGLSPMLLQAVESLGFERPSPIQALAIPVALAGRDVVGLSETGSGKTAAFGLPMLQAIDVSRRETQALIVCPTRELAVQVCEQVHILGSGYGEDLIVAPVYGGASMERQFKLLARGAQIVVGTPGRLLDLWSRKALVLSRIRMVVLDEADRMLDMGFRDDMEELLGAMPAERQTLFFSATMNREVERLIQSFGRDPELVQVKRTAMTVASIDQICYEVRERSKVEVLSRLLDIEPPRLAIVFCNTKRSVDECTEALIARGYAADRLHGDITQMMRERVLKRFREGSVELLVATDVAARGLDIEEVDAVFNYDLPQDPEDYVHRIGRTGRAGRSGRAISFVYGRDIYRLQNIERYTRQKIRRDRIPTQEQVEGRRADQLLEMVRDTLESGEFAHHEDLIDRLLEAGHTATDIANALFSLLYGMHSREGEEIAEDRAPAPPPPRDRERDRDRGDAPPRENRRERGTRFDREERFAPRRGPGGNEGMVTLFVSLGKTGGMRPGDLAGMLYREAQLPEGAVGRISLFPRHTLVDVRADVADDIIERCRDSKLRGKKIRIDYDRGA
ncbi:MAG: DEAD/DEAH box helicase [Verrucomicrobiales bacterium]|nr:DEAD/DEAH box helicase [Verrucomicrobiales bacterium]